MDLRRWCIFGLLAVGLAAGCENEREVEQVGPAESARVGSEELAEETFGQPRAAEEVEVEEVEIDREQEGALGQQGQLEEGAQMGQGEMAQQGEIAEQQGQIGQQQGQIGQQQGMPPTQATAQEQGVGRVFTITAVGTFDEVKDRFDKAAEGMENVTLSESDQNIDGADKAQLEKFKVFTISSPELTSTLLQQKPSLALDLPLRILVLEQGGQTQIIYTDPKEIASRHGISQADPNVAKLHGFITTVVNRASKPEAVLGEEEMRIQQDPVLGEEQEPFRESGMEEEPGAMQDY